MPRKQPDICDKCRRKIDYKNISTLKNIATGRNLCKSCKKDLMMSIFSRNRAYTQIGETGK